MEETLKENKAYPVIDEKWCKCCYLCVHICPKKVFDIAPEIGPRGAAPALVARPEDCIRCFQCEWYCPDMAIKVLDKLPK